MIDMAVGIGALIVKCQARSEMVLEEWQWSDKTVGAFELLLADWERRRTWAMILFGRKKTKIDAQVVRLSDKPEKIL